MAGEPQCLGREAPLAAVEAFLDGADRWPGALVIEGETGIGKSTVWSVAVDAARERSFRVLAIRPVEAEAELALCAFADLLDGLHDDALDAVPVPQRRALDTARLLTDRDDRYETDDRHAGVALLTVLRSMAAAAPVVIAVDDVEWVDGPSARAITFALRRLRAEPVGVLVTQEKGSDFGDPLELDRTLPAGAVRTVRLGPLDGDALRVLLRTRTGPDAPANTALLEIERMSSGNPGIALEIARAAPLADGPGTRLSVPSRLRDAAHDDVDALGPGAADALLVVAALTDPRASIVEEVLGADPTAALAVADAAGVVKVDGDRVAFTQPLVGSTLYFDAPPERRRRLHRRIAEVVTDAEDRSFHLALAADGPDAVVAGAVDAAAVAARARGAYERAAELLELACSLTPTEHHDDRYRRTLDAADDHLRAGDAVRARRLLEALLANLRSGPARAVALARLGRIRGESDSLDAAIDLGEQALTEAAPADALRATVAGDLAADELLRLAPRRAGVHGADALDRAEELGDDQLVAESIGALAISDGLVGGSVWAPIVDVGIRLEALAPGVRPARSASFARAQLLIWEGDLAGARRVLLALRRQTADGTHQGSSAAVSSQLARLECLAGDWSLAATLAADAEATAARNGQEARRALALGVLASVAALRGDEEDTRRRVEECRALASATGCRLAELEAGAALGLLELSLGNAAEAVSELLPAWHAADAADIREPGALRFVPDLIEAALAAGRTDLAAELLEPFEARAGALDRAWAVAVARRCRGLARAAEGDVEGALEVLEPGVHEGAKALTPFDAARSELTSGRTLRRAKQWGPARAALERAARAFDALGAPRWAALADDALARVGGRTPADATDLTTSERQTAELVVRGLTNREVADTLYISLKTVEATLTRVYRKLGVRSRAELRASHADALGPPPQDHERAPRTTSDPHEGPRRAR